MLAPILTFCVLIALLSVFIFIYNSLIKLRQMTENGWSDIDVQLKRRADLIPQIVQAVKAYANHEKTLFSEIVEKRNAALQAGNNEKVRAQAETALSQPVSRLLALAEDYPALKANENFLDLQNELSDTENKIEMARRFYNGAVRELNTKIQSIPSNIIAGLFSFKTRDYFEIAMSDATKPVLDFDV